MLESVVVLVSLSLATGCGGNRISNHWLVDYTRTAHGAYMLNLNVDDASKDSLNFKFVAQYFSPSEVLLQTESFEAFWGDSKVPVRTFKVPHPSGYHSELNASGAGPYAYLIAGVILDERKEMLDSLRYSLVLNVMSPSDSSLIERIPLSGRIPIHKR
ncbi:MAG: hypothetical protein IPH75_16280 [bacterium]|nr:hypothetical protein [bacterium]